MNKEEILKFFEEENAIRHGHFVLSSGKRSSIYCQCAKLFENPDNGRYVCNELKKIILKKNDIDKTSLRSRFGSSVFFVAWLRPAVTHSTVCQRRSAEGNRNKQRADSGAADGLKNKTTSRWTSTVKLELTSHT